MFVRMLLTNLTRRYFDWEISLLQAGLSEKYYLIYQDWKSGQLSWCGAEVLIMSEKERTLRSLAGVEGLWARICRKVAKGFIKVGDVERFKQWNAKRLEALNKRDSYLAQANELHHSQRG